MPACHSLCVVHRPRSTHAPDPMLAARQEVERRCRRDRAGVEMRQRSLWRACAVLLVMGRCRDAPNPVGPEENRMNWGWDEPVGTGTPSSPSMSCAPPTDFLRVAECTATNIPPTGLSCWTFVADGGITVFGAASQCGSSRRILLATIDDVLALAAAYHEGTDRRDRAELPLRGLRFACVDHLDAGSRSSRCRGDECARRFSGSDRHSAPWYDNACLAHALAGARGAWTCCSR